MKLKKYSFEDLETWQKLRVFKKDIYMITASFPDSEKFGLTSQVRRSACSMSANLVEGSGRSGYNDKANFTNTAYSSGLETIDHIITAYDLDYIDQETYEYLRSSLDKIMGMLIGLYKYQLRKGESLSQKVRRQNGKSSEK